MSTQASAVPIKPTEKVEIDLTEKGLTDLAKMLVQSGRISAPSFTNWCSRIAPQASRWARGPAGASNTGKAKEKSNKKSSTATSKDGPKDGKPSSKEVKDLNRLSGFKKAWPSCNLTSWNDVLNASEVLKRPWMQHNKSILHNVADRKAAAQAYLESLNLTEEEMRLSKVWFPVFPGKENKELYDSISFVQALPAPAAAVVSITEITQATGDLDKAAPSNAWKGGVPKLITDQPGTTGTSLQQSLASNKTAITNSRKKASKGRGGGRK